MAFMPPGPRLRPGAASLSGEGWRLYFAEAGLGDFLEGSRRAFMFPIPPVEHVEAGDRIPGRRARGGIAPIYGAWRTGL